VRIFLLTLAVVDDLIAIVLIAVLFTANLALAPLTLALGLLVATWLVQKRVALPAPLYVLVALATWMLAVQAGVHSSVMAVAAAMIVPARDMGRGETLLEVLEHAIHPVSAFLVLPLFAFCAAGVSLADFGVSRLAAGVPAGIALGLALGKPLGVGLAYLAVARLIRAPGTLGRFDVLFVGCLCGIGFTMSLFIGGLAFAGDTAGESSARIGVLAGSLLALALSVFVVRLRPSSPRI
jgi:NhaA family Na+:H+ antiporter